MDTTNTITKTDLQRIEKNLQKVLDATKKGNLDSEYVDLLNHLVDSINDLKLMVEFDHEKRISAIEEFLSQI